MALFIPQYLRRCGNRSEVLTKRSSAMERYAISKRRESQVWVAGQDQTLRLKAVKLTRPRDRINSKLNTVIKPNRFAELNFVEPAFKFSNTPTFPDRANYCQLGQDMMHCCLLWFQDASAVHR